MSFSRPWRPYQREANEQISFTIENKLLVKMFCGTGKSLLMRYGKAFQDHSLCVYVFPSLSLIEQFNADYLTEPNLPVLVISSEDDHTTKEEDIHAFLQRSENKIICVTYQSFHLLKDVSIPMCVVDEAHHVSSETYFPLFLENPNIQKVCFFTATPKKVDYGSIAYEYPYLRGVAEGYLNPFEIRVDLVGEDTNRILYESIARAYFTTGNNRILTFHADVNTDSPTSVRNFVNPTEIQKAFEHISKEFGKPVPTVHVRGFYTEMKAKERRQLLNVFDASQDVFLLCSCETMGEGVDTKNANMCVFVDPKSSFVKIIQNIGRIVRKQFGVDKPHSTILIPIYIQKEKYEACTTAEECDARIREDMSKGGDFTPILNVLSALRQEDEDLYEICLHYPNEYSPQEIEENLKRQGYTIGEEVDIDEVWEQEGAQLDVHSHSLEEPIVSHGETDHVINVLEDGDTYYEIIGEAKKIEPPGKRVKLTVHTNADVQVLWKLKGEMELGSCLMDCEVIDNWNERLEELRTFLEKESRNPNRNKEHEKQLAQWVNDQKVRYKKGIMQSHKKEIWKKFIKKFECYFKSPFDKWYESLTCLKKYIDKHQKLPDIKHKKLQKWLFDQDKKYKYDKMKDEIYNEWTKFLIEYKPYFKSTDEIWTEKMNEYKDFVKKNGKKPSSNATDINERTLSCWSLRNLKLFNDVDYQRLYENRYLMWKEFIELYSILSKEDSWYKNLDSCCNFIDIHKRRPCDSSKDKTEQQIGNWLVNTITNLNMKRKAMKCTEKCNKFQEFLQKYKSYLKTNKDLWYEKFDRLKQFIEMYKRRPHEKSKDVNEDELGSWLQTQMNSFKTQNHIMKESEICNVWKLFIEENESFLKTQREKDTDNWNENLKQCIQYIECNHKRPERSTPLGTWLKNQLSSYNTTNPDRQLTKQKHELLKQFIEKYLSKKSMKLLTKTIEPTEYEKKQRVKTELSTLHQLYKTMRSDTLAQHFIDHPTAWTDYHAISESNEASFPEESIPRNQVIRELDKLRTKRPKRIVDMGCGKALIAKHFQGDPRFTFINIDHVAVDETVQVGDISKLPLEEDTVEICILSLALWGSNCKEYLREAHRVLETNGILYLIEPTKRWTEKEPTDRLREALKDFHVKWESIEKFSFFICIK